MSKKRTPKSNVDDARFEEFLQKQFAELKREIGRHAANGAPKEGKVLSFSPRIPSTWLSSAKGGWKYGVAAAVLVAVVVPSVIQLNYQRSLADGQKAELNRNAEKPKSGESQQYYKDRPEAEETERPTERKDALSQNDKTASKREKKSGLLESKKDEAPKAEARAPMDALTAEGKNLPAGDKEAAAQTANAVREGESNRMAAGSSADADADSSGGYRSEATVTAAPSAPAPASLPSAKAKSRSMDSGSEANKADNFAASAEEKAAPAQRSLSVDDGKARLKKQSIADEEKTEMETLWKEFEKDPKTFNKDKRRSARLRTLLSRHNEKSRAKRMRSVETQKAY